MLIRCDALRLDSISLVGRTKPLIVECEYSVENIPIRKSLIVKTIGLPEIIPSALYCELLGNLLAREFGIRTPKPFIVDFSEDFVQATNKILWEKSVKIKAGLGVGCEYFSQGFTTVKPDMFLSREQFEQAVMLYGFDLISQNPDRQESNPNCAVKGDKIIAFDFEKSLSFIYPIIGQKPKPWELSKLNLTADEKHIFSRNLKAKENEINWQPIVEKAKQISQEKIEAMCAFIPTEFGNYSGDVCEHFASIVDNNKQLEFELQRSLL